MEKANQFAILDDISKKLIKAKKDFIKLETDYISTRAEIDGSVRHLPQNGIKPTEAGIKARVDEKCYTQFNTLQNARSKLAQFEIEYEVITLKIKYL